MPIAVVVDGANRHDMKLVERTLEATMIQRPEPTSDLPQSMCLDKGYDYPEVRALVAAWGYTGHIRSRGEERVDKATILGQVRGWRQLACPRSLVATHRAAVASGRPKAKGRKAPRIGPGMYGRDLLYPAHGLPVEGFAAVPRSGQHGA